MNLPERIPTLVSLLLLAACDLPGAGSDDGNGTSGGDGAQSDGAMSSGDTSGGGDDGVATDDASGGDTPSDTTGGGNDTTDMPAGDCTEATLFAGNPYFTGDLEGWNPAGQGLLDDPPLRMRHIAETGGQIAIDTQFEIWMADDTQVRRLAGDELELDSQYQPSGACADVRLLKAEGVAALPNGNLVVADVRGNGLVELSDPLGDCTAAPIAGNPDQTFDTDVFDGAAAQGDIDGPGAQARFFGVERPVADDDGNVYVVDGGNSKIKKVAGDADRTVSTLFDYPGEDLPMGMTVLGGVLYVSGATPTEDFLWAIDVASGTQTVLYQGRGLFEEIDSTQQALMLALDDDGVDLLVGVSQGYIYRVSTAGEPLGVIAGFGRIVDYPTDLDLGQPIPTAELPIHSYALNTAGLLRVGDDILFTNTAGGVGFHVWSIHCQ